MDIGQNINLLMSFAAGLLSFLSPCVLPLVPAYLSLIGGLTFQDLKNSRYKKSSLVVRALFFIAGFTVIFVIMGAFLWGAFHIAAGPISSILLIASGCIVILLGLNVIFDFLSFLNRERRLTPTRKPAGAIGVFAAGMALGAGWSPCIGPLLGGIIALTASGATLWGAANLAAYSLGLGVPFIALALAFLPVSVRLEKMKKHFNAVRIASGILLIFIGILILLGRLAGVSAAAFQLGMSLERASRNNPWAVRGITAAIYFILGALPMLLFLIRRRTLEAPANQTPPMIRIVWLILFAALCVLELSGILHTAHLLADWFLIGEISPL